MRAGSWRAAALALAFVLPACEPSAPPSASPSADEPAPAASPSATTVASASSVAEPAEHRIGVRVIDGVAELFDRATDERWIPRSFNH